MVSIFILGVGILIGAFVVGGIVWAVREDMKPASTKASAYDKSSAGQAGEATQFENKEENLKKIESLYKILCQKLK